MEPTPLPVTPPTPVITPTVVRNDSPFLIVFLTIAFLLALTAAAYFFIQMQSLQSRLDTLTAVQPSPTPTPTPTMAAVDPTADWLTYSDSRLGFSFKYPENWEVRNALIANQSNPTHINDQVFLGIAPITIKEDFLGSIQVTTTSEAEAIAQIKNFPQGSPRRIVSEKKISFLAYPATEIITENTAAQVQDKTIVFTKDNFTYILSGGGSKDNTIIYQVLSTFKFGDTASKGLTCPESGWVDCMPILDAVKEKNCSATAMAWYKQNCPNFQGAAL